MVIVLKKNISNDERSEIKTFLVKNNFKTNEIIGEEQTIIAAVGKLQIDPCQVELLEGVDRVIPISKPYKMASREFKPENTVIEIPNIRNQLIRIGGQRITVIAGPCAVESQQQMFDIAKSVSSSGAVMLRGGAYKPRTSPYSFQGLGEEGLKYLKTAGDKYGMPVVTEIVAAEYITAMENAGIDVYQVGARNMQNFEMLKRLGKLNKPVILKRGLCATMEEWLMAAEYLLSSGTDKVILCERGIRTYEKATRNTLDLSAIPVMRSMTHLPIIVDPSHAVGIRNKIPPMGLAAIAAGSDGIIVEVHNNPDKALSDGAQSLYPEQFEKLMRDVQAMAPVVDREVTHIRKMSKKLTNVTKSDSRISELKCAFSGKRGAFAQQAVTRYFDKDVEAVQVDSFTAIFQSVIDGKVDYGMIPIENSLAGSVYDNYDNLARFEDVSIVGSITLRIKHALLAKKEAKKENIHTVFSHPQAFSQCSKYLQEKHWDLVNEVSTATAAELVSKSDSMKNAAIASSVNADYYNLSILDDGIEDDPCNYTRFFIIAPNHIAAQCNINLIRNKNVKDYNFWEIETITAFNCQKNERHIPNTASFIFSVKNEPGALYESLGVFHNAELNLTRLESRPIPGKPWQYKFYTDAKLDTQKKRTIEYIADVLKKLSQYADDIRLTGIYSEFENK